MDAVAGQPASEIKKLQRSINDLISVLALPALWSGGEPRQVVRTLSDTLLAMLRLDMVYVRLNERFEGVTAGELRTSRTYNSADLSQICSALDRWLPDSEQNFVSHRKLSPDGREISVTAVRLGLQGEVGMLLAGSERPHFPEQEELLILNVAANQAVIGLQEAHRRAEQTRVARELDERVAQRTRELAMANEVLRQEITERANVEARLLESDRALRKALDEIRHSEGKLRQVLDTIPNIAWCNLPDGPNEYLNKRWRDYTGLTPEESHGWGWQVAMHPDDLPNLMKKWKEIMSTGQADQIEGRFRGRDGVYRWFLIRAEPFRDETGRILRWYGTTTDIEELKQTQRALQESEAELGVIINTIPAMVWTARTDGSAEFFNENYLAYVGLSQQEARDWEWTRSIHPDDMPKLGAIWQETMAAGTAGEAEARYRRFDGKYRWFLIRVNPMRDAKGAIIKWFGLNTDIEDRKNVEEQLRRSEAFLAEGQNLARVGNFSWLVETDEIRWSEQLYEIFEFEGGETITLEKIGRRVHPDDLHLLVGSVDQARRGARYLEYEHRLLMPDQSVKHLHLIAHAVRNKDGCLEYMGAVQDVTQRHAAESALARARTELANVARVTSLGVLTASIAHEVNQPISGIVTNASTCLRMLASDPPNLEGARETARRAIRDGNRAAEVIARLRTLFTRREGTVEWLSLNDAAREVVAMSMSEFQRAQVIIRPEFADDLPAVRGDRVQLQQVILNLLRNAADAMSNVHDRARQLVIRTEREDHSAVRLSVIDSGNGFDRQAADRLFQPFYTTKPEGMGIGLSISRSIIEAHQGRLWAKPNDGPGATFCFSLDCTCNTKV